MRKWMILAATLCLVTVADQLSKAWVIANLAVYESLAPLPALAPLFQLTRSSNTGAAFGILPMAGDIILLVALLIVAGLLWHVRGLPASARFAPLAIGLVIGGAAGNILDRLQHGHVIDFIHYQIPNLVSNVSNLADHAVVIGVALVLLESVLRERHSKKAGPADLPASAKD